MVSQQSLGARRGARRRRRSANPEATAAACVHSCAVDRARSPRRRAATTTTTARSDVCLGRRRVVRNRHAHRVRPCHRAAGGRRLDKLKSRTEVAGEARARRPGRARAGALGGRAAELRPASCSSRSDGCCFAPRRPTAVRGARPDERDLARCYWRHACPAATRSALPRRYVHSARRPPARLPSWYFLSFSVSQPFWSAARARPETLRNATGRVIFIAISGFLFASPCSAARLLPRADDLLCRRRACSDAGWVIVRAIRLAAGASL